MDTVSRIGVSLEPDLLSMFDEAIAKKGYVSRSEAIRDLVRDSLAENEWKSDDLEMVGTVIIVYDLRVNDVLEKIQSVYRLHRGVVSYNSGVAVDEFDRMEIVVADGKLKELRTLLTDITAIKGVLRGKLVTITPGSCHVHQIGLRK
jgi:CopG family nickel-responsive transcriptional regulator